MPGVNLKKMNQVAFVDWRKNLIQSYAAANVESGRWPAETALTQSEESTGKLLNQGIDTPDHYIWNVLVASEVVGDVWIMIQKKVQSTEAFVYNLNIRPENRGFGFGKEAMLAVEVEAKKLGAASIGLHVFNYNRTAFELYLRLGYKIVIVNEVSQVMEKTLSSLEAKS